MPRYVLAILQGIYTRSTTAYLEEGFTYKTNGGVKEGCPLSPTLCVVHYNVILSELKEQLFAASVYAYRDDMALVVADLQEARAAVQAIQDIGCKFDFLMNAKKTKVHHWRF